MLTELEALNFTGLSGTVTDGPAKVTDCSVTLPATLHQVQSEVHILDKPDTWYWQACLINQQTRKCNRQAVKLTERSVARWLKLGSDSRVGNSCRNIK